MKAPDIKLKNKVAYFDKACNKVKMESSIRELSPGVFELNGYFCRKDGSLAAYHKNADRYMFGGGEYDPTRKYETAIVGIGYQDECGEPVHLQFEIHYKRSEFPDGLDIRAEWGKDTVQAFAVDRRITYSAWKDTPIAEANRVSTTYVN